MPSESINTGALFPGGSIVEYTKTDPTGQIFPFPKFTADLINGTWRQASIAANAMDAKFSAIESWLPAGTPTDIISGASESPPVVEPPVDIPSSVNATDVMSLFDTKYQELVALLVDKFTVFQTTYFPDDQAAYDAVQNWLLTTLADPSITPPANVIALDEVLSGFIAAPTVSEAGLTALSTALFGYINSPTTPIPLTVIDQIWENSRSQVTREKLGAIDAAFQTFAARRFPLPTGALNATILSIEQGAQDKLAAASREAAIKGADMAYDKVKFAVTQAQDLHKTLVGLTEDKLKMAVAQAQSLRMAIFDAQEKRLALAVDKLMAMRQLAMNSAVEYIKALASGPDMASRLVGIGYDAQSKLISAASQFYGVRKEVAQLATQNNQFNVTSALQAAEKNQAKEVTLIDDKLKAMLTECQAVAQTATSLFNNLHASTGVSSSSSNSSSHEY